MSEDLAPSLAARLSAIHQAAFHGQSRGWSGDEIISLARTGHLITADEAAGFALISAVGDTAELLTIAVAPEQQGQGIGRVLLAKAEAWAGGQQALIMFLEVAADNAPALALYGKQGFKQIGRRKQYYKRSDSARVDALIMSKALAPSAAFDTPGGDQQ